MKFQVDTMARVKPGFTNYDDKVGLVTLRPKGHAAGNDAVFLFVDGRDEPLAIHPDYLEPYPYPAMTFAKGQKVLIKATCKSVSAGKYAVIGCYNFNREAYNVTVEGRDRGTIMVKESDLMNAAAGYGDHW